MSSLVGEKIKSIRLEYGDNKREFGERFNPKASGSNVSKWEKGKSVPSPKRLKAIAKLGNMTVDELLRDNCGVCAGSEFKASWYAAVDFELDAEYAVTEDRKIIIPILNSRAEYLGFLDIDINYCPNCGRKLPK